MGLENYFKDKFCKKCNIFIYEDGGWGCYCTVANVFIDEEGDWATDDDFDYWADIPSGLIAAAPELLAVCMEMLPFLSTENDALDYAATNDGRASAYDVVSLKMRRAIAAATEVER